ncbi:MAG: hypothetical protein KJ690_10670 [Alphaproteobacteria bacterium]|uniref:hypothetical protein n=1 Tax=Brevundimonas sp. TaxID=1871086 RepID=UPI0025BCD9DE|nr:hypothetical protein [Brevundimonas sp.]MBU4136865.1 hypothetical protein [Alphaproteobacteria bacterium]
MMAPGTDPVEIIFFSVVVAVLLIIVVAALATGRVGIGRWILRMHHADRRTNPGLFWLVIAMYLGVLAGSASMLVGLLDFSDWRLLP